jgi:23S rRNA (cytidine1920-2'-O)/16S rRNA (cytidine1409-2'-O)-methyltransferase
VAVVAAGLASTRSRARDLIKRGFVCLDGLVVCKASAPVPVGAVLSLADDAPKFVSRGGEKLAAALKAFGFDVRGRVVLDIGASTGGFTDCVLQGGAERVYAIDVGRGQLHPRIACDTRVVDLEMTDARNLDRVAVPEPVGGIVADLSFVSVTKVLEPALGLAAEDAWLVVLIKPQFELAPADIGKGGIVANEAARNRAVAHVRGWVEARSGWRVTRVIPAPIRGGDGNQEFLLGAIRDDG